MKRYCTLVIIMLLMALGACEQEPEPFLLDATFRPVSVTANIPVDLMGVGIYSRIVANNRASNLEISPLRFSSPYGRSIRFSFIENVIDFDRVWSRFGRAAYYGEIDPVSRRFTNLSNSHIESGSSFYPNANYLPIFIQELRLMEADRLYLRFEHIGIFDWQAEAWKSVVFEIIYEKE